MKSQPQRPVARESLLLWLIEALVDRFEDHAILKGGMALRLLDSERLTGDADFVLVPFESKKEIVSEVRAAVGQLEDAEIRVSLHSTMVRVDVALDAERVSLECSVATECSSVPMTTASLASSVGVPARVVRVMSPDVALSHKLAAWNERRLFRDLYDAYFLSARAGASVERSILAERLSRVRRGKRKPFAMSTDSFCGELRAALSTLTDEELRGELGGLVSETELAGAALRIRVALSRLCEELELPRASP